VDVVLGDQILGSIKTPWAVDSAGTELPTEYRLDGHGSNIIFQLKYESSKPVLVVDTYIVNDFFLSNAAYAALAYTNWLTFSQNLSS
jgi:hypothetical protein